MRRALMLCLPLLAVACQPIQDSSRAAGKVVKEATNTEANFWRDVFTYHPPKPVQDPQTRYCYKMQSDIVCYDSLQPSQTAKLAGYQDGNQISWVQPGGGSLGASGGEAVGPRIASGVQGAPGGAQLAMDTSTVAAAPIPGSGTIFVHDTPKYAAGTGAAKFSGKSSVAVVPNPNIQGAAATAPVAN